MRELVRILRAVPRVLRGLLRVGWTLAWLLLVTPWIAGALIAEGLKRLRRIVRVLAALRFATSRTMRCPLGHDSQMLGVFECRTCGSLFAGWAFQACPICRSSCGWVNCEHCGFAIRNPFV